MPVVDGIVVTLAGAAQFSFASNGLLAYASDAGQETQALVWVSPNGGEEQITSGYLRLVAPRLSPDGTHVAVGISETIADVGMRLWVWDLERAQRSRLTTDQGLWPAWTPDGSKVSFARGGVNNIFWRPVDLSSEEETLVEGRYQAGSGSWSPDGRSFVYYEVHPDTRRDIWTLSLGEDPRPFLATEFNETAPQLSPNGRWIAYTSDQSGDVQVYVQPYPQGGRVIPISAEGGTEPVWSRDGRTLFYRDGDRMMAVDVSENEEFRPGGPTLVFTGSYDVDGGGSGIANFDVARDGRFLMIRRDVSSTAKASVVQSWFDDLAERVPLP